MGYSQWLNWCRFPSINSSNHPLYLKTHETWRCYIPNMWVTYNLQPRNMKVPGFPWQPFLRRTARCSWSDRPMIHFVATTPRCLDGGVLLFLGCFGVLSSVGGKMHQNTHIHCGAEAWETRDELCSEKNRLPLKWLPLDGMKCRTTLPRWTTKSCYSRCTFTSTCHRWHLRVSCRNILKIRGQVSRFFQKSCWDAACQFRLACRHLFLRQTYCGCFRNPAVTTWRW